jgi:hypothetical protein
MTRWTLLSEIISLRDNRKAIGKAWPLFHYLIYHMDKDNKLITSYAELSKNLNESVNTLKTWREHLVKNKVIRVIKGSISMTIVILPPYDSLVTCEQTDEAQIRMVGDPTIKKVLDQFSVNGNMNLIPVIADLSRSIEEIKRRIGA